MSTTNEKITLECVAVRGKLRIRFHGYTNAEGKTYHNVYNNTYNCQFPKAIRKEGRYYEIPSSDLTFAGGNGKTPFYRVKGNNIKVLTGGPNTPVVADDDSSTFGLTPVSSRSTVSVARPEHVFEVTECVICLEGAPQEIFVPCGHLCTCSGCYQQMKRNKAVCPLCRRAVLNTVLNTA
ncbi:RING-HC finger protein [archaeon]|nr:MAG: RING-HC finger protein [archaeon]